MSTAKATMVQIPQDEETAIEMERNGGTVVGSMTVGLSDDDNDEDHHSDEDDEHSSRDGLMRNGTSPNTTTTHRRRQMMHNSNNNHLHETEEPTVTMNRGTLCQLVLVTCLFTALLSLVAYMKGKQAGAQSYATYMKNKHNTTTSSSSSVTHHNDHDDDDDYFEPTPPPRTKAPHGSRPAPASAPTSPSADSSNMMEHYGPMMDTKTFSELVREVGLTVPPGRTKHTVTYNEDWITSSLDPFQLLSSSLSSSNALTPPMISHNTESDDGDDATMNAYLRSPHIVNNRLVFLAEGDAYMTVVSDGYDYNKDGNTPSLPLLSAMKLTTTVGNVLDPKWHPTLPLLAFTATYSGRRDVYLMDYRSTSTRTPIRLTYWNVGSVSGVIGWDVNNDDTTTTSIIFRALSNDVSLPDYRLYKLHLTNSIMATAVAAKEKDKQQQEEHHSSVLEIEPVPLSQAMDGARYNNCWYFVRYKQSSQTIRYVGGTAEHLSKYCDGQSTTTLNLFGNDHGYHGTSKSPQIYPLKDGQTFLFFLSDRGLDSDKKKWIPDRMNVWAVDITNADNDNSPIDSLVNAIQVTDTSCDFEGRTIQEFTVDVVTGNMVVRIGADLYIMSKSTIESKLVKSSKGSSSSSKTSPAPQPTPAAAGGDSEGDDKGDGNRRTALRRLGDNNKKNSTNEVSEEKEDEKDDETTSDGEEPDPDVVPEKDDDDTTDDDEIEEVQEKTKEESKPNDPLDKNSTLAPDDIDDLDTIDDDDEMILGNLTMSNETEPPMKYFYDYQSPELVSRADAEDGVDHVTGLSTELTRLPVVVHSDFSTQQERLIPVSVLSHLKFADVFDTVTQDTKALLTLRGQVWVAPVTDDDLPIYEEAGQNLPARQYRVAPGAMMGGSTRILASFHVPNPVEDDTSDRRLGIILATDPLTDTAEHAFYLIEVQPSSNPLFVDMDSLPKPFLGGSVSGGSTKEGGLGSVKPDTVSLSPCGNRMAWSDTDGRIVAMNLPHYQDLSDGTSTLPKYVVLPNQNELGEPMVGDEVELTFSPGGRYLAVEHNARNQFDIISIVDLGDPLAEPDKVADIALGRIVQATPSRFNSMGVYWGQSPTDIHDFARETAMAGLFGTKEPDDVSTTLYFLSDRDIFTDVSSPWGYRQRMPHFVSKTAVYALPFKAKDVDDHGQYRGGGAVEVQVDVVLQRKSLLKTLLSSSKASGRRERRKLANSVHPLAGAFGYAEQSFSQKYDRDTGRLLEGDVDDDHLREAVFPLDMDIDFGPTDLSFARRAYRLATIDEGNYVDIICQSPDDGSLVLVKNGEGKEGMSLQVFMPDSFPSDQYNDKTFMATSRKIFSWQLSTSRNYFSVVFSPDGAIRVVPNSAAGIAGLLTDLALDDSVVDKTGLTLSVWPELEYRQMYSDAWRMLRDYYYDPDMTGIDWPAIHDRYLPLVQRCTKREELDDTLAQMASELSALHVFVYGGEYDSPLHGSSSLAYATEVGGLGAILKRTPEWNGYMVMSIPIPDPDFTMIDQQTPIYSPLSDQALRLSGQSGLQVGDVIVGVNGESVMRVPDIHMLLRGKSGASVRLDVLRLSSGNSTTDDDDGTEANVEPLIVSPLDPSASSDLLYRSWEWKTEQLAQKLAMDANITVGYVHLQDMSGPEAEDAFARGFFPNYQKQGFILDVRHNRGGNIDAWVLDVLQRKPWMYWKSRDFDTTNGGLGWDEHYAFRGHIVVLLDEKTSSDGEGVSRGISELGLGKLIGTRTWGGGIWLASDNHLVDGGIATAPEIGTYNDHLGWGLSIEQVGVEPDIVVDNDPHETYMGKDRQLERAIQELTTWIEQEPVVTLTPPAKKKDMTMGDRECKA